MIRIYWFGIECGGENMGNLYLYVCSMFQNNSYDGNPKNNVGNNVFIPLWTWKQMDTQIINGMFALTMWKMCNYRMW